MNIIHSIPLFTIVMSLLTSVVCSIINAKWAKRLYGVMGLVVTGLTFIVLFHTLRIGESFVFMMGHFPAPWGNEIQVGPLEAALAFTFCLILYLSVYDDLFYTLGTESGSKLSAHDLENNYYTRHLYSSSRTSRASSYEHNEHEQGF